MPNWVYNALNIQGKPEQLEQLKTQLNQPFSVIHDSWNIETGKMEKTPTSYNNPIFAFWNIVKPDNLDTYFGEQPKHDPTQPITFDSDHWYDWNIRNWGTKWDVANKDENSPYNDTDMETTEKAVIYTFNTAWSVPLPALINLSSQYPELILHLFYQEETGWGGETEIMNGKIIRDMSYDSQCRDCDALDTMEYCENDCGEVCSSCHWLGEADLDSVAECDEHKVFLDEEHIPQYRLDNA
jgi:hypothetical protein